MMQKFHRSIKLSIYQCSVCHEAWSLKTNPSNQISIFVPDVQETKVSPKKFQLKIQWHHLPFSENYKG